MSNENYNFGKARMEYIFNFRSLTRWGSYAETAKFLNVPVYKLQNDIVALEKALGYALIARNKSSITLTPEGKSFLVYANQVYEGLESLDSKKSRSKDPIVISTTNAVAHFVLPQAISRFMIDFPDASFKCLTGGAAYAYEPSKADLCIGKPYINRSDLSKFIVKSYTYTFFASQDYLLKNPIAPNLEELSGHNLILGKADDEKIDNNILNRNTIFVECTLFPCIIGLAQNHLGIALLPNELGFYQDHGLVRLYDDFEVYYPLAISFRQSSHRKQELTTLKNIILETINTRETR